MNPENTRNPESSGTIFGRILLHLNETNKPFYLPIEFFAAIGDHMGLDLLTPGPLMFFAALFDSIKLGLMTPVMRSKFIVIHPWNPTRTYPLTSVDDLPTADECIELISYLTRGTDDDEPSTQILH